MNIKELEKRAERVRKEAEKSGLDEDMSFASTYERYVEQLKILQALKEIVDELIEEGRVIVTKEYLKGQENEVVHPAIREYGNQSAGANRTVQTLERIMRGRTEKKATSHPLYNIINGGD